MSKLSTFLRLLKEDPEKIGAALSNNFARTKVSHILPDDVYLKLRYRALLGRKLDLSNPKTFNEKLQWLKLYDRKPEYTMMVDKYRVREYIAKTIGEEYLIPLLGVWEDPDEIDFDVLPDQFVLKCNHDSGSVILCKDKSTFDIEAARVKLKKHMKKNLFWWGREWPYKEVPRRIIAEKYMVDESGTELKDYKIFCFNGKAKIIEVDFDRFVAHKRNLYSTRWESLNFEIQYPRDISYVIPRPETLNEILLLAEKLSHEIPHLRVDFYLIENKIYFGELTFYHEAGFGKFNPEEWDYKLGGWIELPDKIMKKHFDRLD